MEAARKEEYQQHAAGFELRGRTLWIFLREDLDHHNADYIKRVSDHMMQEHPIRTVVFDFTGVEFMDSSGIGVIMGRYRQVNYVGGEVKVVGVSSTVDRIFRMSGLYKLVKRYDTAEALERGAK